MKYLMKLSAYDQRVYRILCERQTEGILNEAGEKKLKELVAEMEKKADEAEWSFYPDSVIIGLKMSLDEEIKKRGIGL